MTTGVGDSKRLITAAVVLSLITVGVMGGVAYKKFATAFNDDEQDKAAVVSKAMAGALSDPFAMGEYDHMQALVDSLKQADPDIAYIIVESPDGRALATTDTTLKNLKLARDTFEQDALKASDYESRPGPNKVIDAVTPIKTEGSTAGILRVGYSTERQAAALADGITMLIAAGIVLVVINAVVFALIGRAKPQSA